MDPFEELLGLRGDSALGQHLYLSMCGLRASLAEALRQHPDDPGAENAARLLAWLDPLLGGAPPRTAPGAPDRERSMRPQKAARRVQAARQPEPPPAPATTTKAEGPKLARLCEEFRADREAAHYLGRFEFVGSGDAELWQEFQRFLLRLDRQSAERWGQRAEEYAREAGARASDGRVLTLRSAREELLFPGLEGEIEAAGLRLGTEGVDGPLPDEGGADEEVRALADIVRVCLHFLSTDPHVRHELESVRSYKSGVLNERQKELYSAELLRRFGQFKDSKLAPEPDPGRVIRDVLALAEAVLSLVYHPPADPGSSWWGRLHKEVRRLVESSAGAAWKEGRQVVLTWPSGRFSQMRNYATNNLIVDEGYAPDMVVACLRPHAIIEGRETKGRVLYRE